MRGWARGAFSEKGVNLLVQLYVFLRVFRTTFLKLVLKIL